MKYLGLYINNNLTVNNHISHLLKQVNKFITIFKHIKHYLTKNAKTLLIKSLIIPHILYACPFLHTMHKYNKKSLKISYTRLIKILFDLPSQTPSKTVLFISNLPSVHSMIMTSLHNLCHSILNKCLPFPTLTNIYSPFQNSHCTQNKYNHRILLYHTNKPYQNFIYHSFVLYNENTHRSNTNA